MNDEQFLVIVGLLSEIRDVLVAGIEASEEPEDPTACPHPEANRVSFATPAQPERWVCNVCKFEHVGLTRN